MAEILIDRCTLRVVRRGGWSWGPDPKRLLEDALRALPALIANQLESLFPDDNDCTYEAPIRIKLNLRPSDLAEAASVQRRPFSRPTSLDFLPLEHSLEAALRSALDVSTSAAETLGQPDVPTRRFATVQTSARVVSRQHAAMQRLLLARLDTNELDRFVRAFTLEELEAWHAAFSTVPQETPMTGLPLTESILEAVTGSLRGPARAPESARAQSLRARLIAATDVAAKLRIPLNHPHIWRALDRFIPLTYAPSIAMETVPAPLSAEFPDTVGLSTIPVLPLPPLPVPAALSPRASMLAQPAEEWTTQIHSALPFLLLTPLARIGYLASLSATLETSRLTSYAYLFGAALAYKVLEPPERDWRRGEPAQRAASVFAGSPHPIADEALLDFSRQSAPYTGLLDRLLHDCVASGRDAAQPVLLRRAESGQSSGFLMLDTGGCFPFAWLEDASGAALLLREMKASVVVMSQEASCPRVFQELDQSGICFVTSVPPSRGEPWKPILQASSRLGWTNHAQASSETVLRAARTLRVSCEEGADLWDQLGVQRVAVPRAKLPALERSLTLAASVALGILSWQLWRDRGRTSPQLALERFHDLDSRVRYTRDAVMVGLPRGRRQSELMEGGFLAPVPGVPWLDGRIVEFGWS